MGLYEAIDSLPSGMKVKYECADGATVIYEPSVHTAGRLDVTVRKQATGARDVRNENHEAVDREWCVEQEQELRSIGIDPDKYSVI